MHVVFVDRSGAHSIWELMGHIAVSCIAEGGRATFVIFDDGRDAYDYEVPDGVEVYTIRVPIKKKFWDLIPQHIIFVREFREFLKRIKPDIVHTNFAVPSIAARWVAFKENVPCIISTQHELYGSMYFHYRWALRLTEHNCSAITYVSDTVARSFDHWYKKNISACTVSSPAHITIPNGVDVDKIRAEVADSPNREVGKIVCAGRMMPVKGQALLLKAFKEVTVLYPHVTLKLIGSGPMEPELRQLVTGLKLDDKVYFTGWMSHEKALHEIASAELLVVPSDGSQEGFGLVVAEALVCGVPLLVSDIPVFREILDRFPDRGIFFVKGDRCSLVRNINMMLAKNDNVSMLFNTLSEEELASLSSRTMVVAYLDLYKKLGCGKYI